MATRYMIGLALALLMPAFATAAGIAQQTQTREIHVLKSEEGDTKVILRSPLLLVYADELSRLAPGQALVAPFVTTDHAGPSPVARLDRQAILDDYLGFADFLLRDFRFSVNGNQVIPEMPEYVVIDTSHPDDVNMNIGYGLMGSLSVREICVSDFPVQSDIADTLIVMTFFLADVMPLDTLKIELLSEAFAAPEGIAFQTRITDYRNGAAETLNFSGSGFEPVSLCGGFTASLAHSFTATMQHILNGYGQMLLWLSLAIAAASLGFYAYRRNRH